MSLMVKRKQPTCSRSGLGSSSVPFALFRRLVWTPWHRSLAQTPPKARCLSLILHTDARAQQALGSALISLLMSGPIESLRKNNASRAGAMKIGSCAFAPKPPRNARFHAGEQGCFGGAVRGESRGITCVFAVCL